MTHFEIRYWDNGVRRCDIYIKETQAKRALDRLATGKYSIPARLMMVTSSHNIEREYREIRKSAVSGVER